MNKRLTYKSKGFFLFAVMLIFLNIDYSYGNDIRESKEELLKRIKRLDKILKEKYFLIKQVEKMPADEVSRYLENDIKSLVGLKIKLFYSLGRIHGYAVFINSKNNYAIIDGVSLKITLYLKSPSAIKTVFFKVEKSGFKRLTLSRGDVIIAFHIKNIKYGEMQSEGIVIPVEAECFHLKASSELYIY